MHIIAQVFSIILSMLNATLVSFRINMTITATSQNKYTKECIFSAAYNTFYNNTNTILSFLDLDNNNLQLFEMFSCLCGVQHSFD